ncbi:unnamed protein product [Clavelina lepadiformis]|uniref:Uncharacterized protein n=1 Tax=Clavelina lepadiformis TaxID=159417 RepID=A0ABP0GK62_CLALP
MVLSGTNKMSFKRKNQVQFGHRRGQSILIFSILPALVHSLITNSVGDHSTTLLDLNTLRESDAISNQGTTGAENHVVLPSISSIPSSTQRTRNRSEGFNLLWLVSSRYLQSSPGLRQDRYHARPGYSGSASHSRRLHLKGIRLHSNLPRRILRYQRIPQMPSNGTVQLKRVITGEHIGFEMELRVENTSGSGYLITGRSLESDEFDTGSSETDAGVLRRRYRDMEAESTSWFGLYSRAIQNRFALRLEYKNAVAASKRKFIVALPHSGLTLGNWHKLAVQIDFKANSIDYWVNCSHSGSFRVQHNRTFPSSGFRVYRLLQHRNKVKMPVQVTFRSVIVTDGANRGLPKQCFTIANVSRQECSGGRVFMNCGPSCEPTCESRFSFAQQGCSATCLKGCHCPPGQVYHRGQCISPATCPCRLGAKRYSMNAEVTINNEICTCVTGKWKCYAVASLTRTPRNKTVEIGGSVNLTCGVSGNPLPNIEWYFPPGVSHRIIFRNGRRISILSLYNVSASQGGQYTCVANGQADGWSANATAYVSVTSPPVITSLPPTVTATLGDPVTSMDCVVSGIPTPMVVWRKPRAILRYFTISSRVTRLKIKKVNGSDAGEYTCIAINSAGRTEQTVRLIVVKLPPPNSMLAFKKKPRDRCVKPGQTATFACKVINHGPETTISWYKNGSLLVGDGKKIIKRRHKLVIRRANRNDAGSYSCMVTTATNEVKAKGRLMIKGKMLPWSLWSPCSASCGGGFTSKVRKCTGVPPNQKTCHGKFSAMKKCNTHFCPGVCSSYGDPHYTTFDGRNFNFQGDCSYILSAAGKDFKIVQFNVGCGSRLSCVRKITTVLGFSTVTGVVDIEVDHTVHFNGVLQTLPFLSSNGALSVAKIGLYIVLRVTDKLEIRWATPHRLYVIVSRRYYGRTRGLCGNFNNNENDDKLSPRGRLLESDLEFGQSWALKDGNANYSCSAVSSLRNPCSRDPTLLKRAQGACFHLLNRNIFGECHTVTTPSTFLSNCMRDICSTSIQDTNMYFCTALAAYSEKCLRHGVVLNWRSSAICPINCTGGMVYQECGSTCVKFCPSDVRDGKICLANDACVAGCYCPPEKVLHKGRCISLLACPCTFNGMTFEHGARHNRNCRKCICRSGGWQCFFNSILCDYPASVKRGPQSQVVPFGHSVAMCCAVAGIPAPVVEWYKNGVKIFLNHFASNLKIENGETHNGQNTTLVIRNTSERDIGLYSCKAVNSHGSHMSNPAALTIVDSTITSCDPHPAFNYVHLPDGCYVLRNGRPENVINLGRCVDQPCYVPPSRRRRGSKCSPTTHCCQPSVTEPVPVRCHHSFYTTTFLVTVVRECACAVCAERTTVVEGVIRSSETGQPAKHVKITYQGRTVGYTTNAGSFRFRIPNLSLETRHITVKFTDEMIRKLSTTVENLLVVPGESTIHSLTMRPCKVTLRFNATEGLQYIFRHSDGFANRMRLTIPPNSLISNRHLDPYRGVVAALISIADKRSMIHNGDESLLPGGPKAISVTGEELLLSPAVVLCISLYNRFRRPLGMIPGRYASLSLTTSGVKMNLKPWLLDDFTGYWRETGQPLDIVPRRDKVLITTAKLFRLNTPWALGIADPPCYLRARVLDANNKTVPNVKIAFSARTADESIATLGSSFDNSKNRIEKITFSSYVEDITTSRTNTNGICLPVGCHDTGMLQASRVGNELVMLEPEAPASNMGHVKEYRSIGYNSSKIASISRVLDTSSHMDSNLTKHQAYFHNQEDCRNTRPSYQTYIFRGEGNAQDGSVLSRSNYRNRVIFTFGMASPQATKWAERGSNYPRYCHVKVQVLINPTFTYRSTWNIHQSVIEAVTYRNKTAGPNGVTMLGWRHVMLKPYSTGNNIENQYACVEYLCGGSRLAQAENLFLYLTIRHTTNSSSLNDIDTLDGPRCNFTTTPPRTSNDYASMFNAVNPSNEVDHFNRGGYVHTSNNLSRRSRRRKNKVSRRRPFKEFPGRTLAESKQNCESSSVNEKPSAYFQCM